MNKDTLAQTYVRHGDAWFFVSTVDRESSALVRDWYAETCVWSWDPKSRRREEFHGNIGEGVEGSIRVHQEIVAHLRETGDPESYGREVTDE